MHSPLEIARAYVEVGVHKTNLSAFKTVLLAIFAGVFIGFAGMASTTAAATIGNPSVGKLVGALIFPSGMAMVLIAGSELFTGNMLIILSVLEKRTKWRAMFKNWLLVYIGNFIGAVLVAAGVVYGHLPDHFDGNLAANIVNAGAQRCNLAFGDSLIRGILCNVLVCTAIWMSFAAKNVSGKLMTSFWPVMVFVLCGLEHCVADMYFGAAALFATREYGIAAKGLTAPRFLLYNILPVTIGNIIGGAALLGVGCWLAYLRHTPLGVASKEKEQEEIDIAEEY